MSKQKVQQNIANNIYQNLLSNSKSSATTEKLIKINTVCKRLVDIGVSLSISNIVKHLNQDGVKITTRSIYNKRDGGNPYRILIDAWIECATASFTQKDSKKTTSPAIDIHSDIIDHSDLAKIEDPVLRYRITLLLGELKGLKNQLNIARNIENLPILQPISQAREVEQKEVGYFLLNNYELEILGSLLSGNHYLTFTKDGALASKSSIKRNETLTSPGLKDALKKIIKSYTHPLTTKLSTTKSIDS